MMNHQPENTFSLDIFEGPLAFLLHLIQKSEINIHDIPIAEITKQYHEKIHEWLTLSVDEGAEFISTATLLILMKSRHLLPKHETLEEVEDDPDPNFEIIHQLLEYCRFKEAAKNLSEQESKQHAFFRRGVHSLPEAQKQLGIEHISINDLAALFEKILHKFESQNKKITEEEWRVSDKIHLLRKALKEKEKISFNFLFSADRLKPELIVNFLALLELMKIGECFVAKEEQSGQVYIFKGSYDAKHDQKI